MSHYILRSDKESEKEILIRHPFVYLWAKRMDLEIHNTQTEFELIAAPKKYEDKLFLFTEDKMNEELSRLENIYKLKLEKNILHKPFGIFKKSLIELSEQAEKIKEIKKTSLDGKIYIGGITLPDRNHLYLECNLFQGNIVCYTWTGLPVR
jgi:hypothetical protein